MLPIITISREYGSGGHAIGEAVAKELGIPFYDSHIVDRVAEESGYAKDYISERGEYTSVLDQWFHSNIYSSTYLGSPQDQIFQIQSNIISEKAAMGPCVIVGRCADYILAQKGMETLNVFIHADIQSRQKRVEERNTGALSEPVEKILQKKDKGRKAYYKFYTDRTWGNYANYQLNLDSGYLGEKTCVDIIVSVARAKDCQ